MEVFLYSNEVNYVSKLLPKSYSLVQAAKLPKGKPGQRVNASLTPAGRLFSRRPGGAVLGREEDLSVESE